MPKTDLETLRVLLGDQREHVFIGLVKKVGRASDSSAIRLQVQVMPDLREIVCMLASPFVGTDAGDYAEPYVGDLCIGVKVDGDEDQAFIIGFLPSKSDTIPPESVGGHRVVRAREGKDLFLVTKEKLEKQAKTLRTIVEQLVELEAEDYAANVQETWEVIAKKGYIDATDEAGISATKVYLGGSRASGSEPLVLGLVLKGFLGVVVDTIDMLLTQLNLVATDLGTHTHICSIPTTPGGPPVTAAVYVAAAAQFLILQTQLLAAKATDLTGDGILSETVFTEK